MADSGSRQLQDHAVDGRDDVTAGHTDSDDMDYEPPTEEEGDNQSDEDFLERFLDEEEGLQDDGGNESELHNHFLPTSHTKPPYLAILHYNGIQIHVAMADDEEDDTTQRERSEPYFIFTLFQTLLLIFQFEAARQRRQILRLLANSEIRRLFRFATDDDEFDDVDEDDEDFNSYISGRRRRAERPDPDRFPKVPSDEGIELMNSGVFGSNEVRAVNSINHSRKKKLAVRILDRELATEGYAQQRVNQRLMAQVRHHPSYHSLLD